MLPALLITSRTEVLGWWLWFPESVGHGLSPGEGKSKHVCDLRVKSCPGQGGPDSFSWCVPSLACEDTHILGAMSSHLQAYGCRRESLMRRKRY